MCWYIMCELAAPELLAFELSFHSRIGNHEVRVDLILNLGPGGLCEIRLWLHVLLRLSVLRVAGACL